MYNDVALLYLCTWSILTYLHASYIVLFTEFIALSEPRTVFVDCFEFMHRVHQDGRFSEDEGTFHCLFLFLGDCHSGVCDCVYAAQ